MSDIKMSEVFDLPLTYDNGVVEDVDGLFIADLTSIKMDKAMCIGINTHDTLVAQNLALKAALTKVLEISGGSNEQNMANFDDELASQHNDDINEIYKLVKALEGVGDE